MNKTVRAKRARAKHLRALANAQAFNQSIWSTVNYRHGIKTFEDHGKYYQPKQRDTNGREYANNDE